MEKQVVIPKSYIDTVFGEGVILSEEGVHAKSTITNWVFTTHSSLINIIWLGVLNTFLGDKANAKEIVSVKHCQRNIVDGSRLCIDDSGVIWDGCEQVYLITYLESDMIATEDELYVNDEDDTSPYSSFIARSLDAIDSQGFGGCKLLFELDSSETDKVIWSLKTAGRVVQKLSDNQYRVIWSNLKPFKDYTVLIPQ